MGNLKPFLTTACSMSPNISKTTVIAMFDEGSTTRTFLEKLDPEEWEIVSFNPGKREVCCLIINDSGTQINMSLTLPVLSA